MRDNDPDTESATPHLAAAAALFYVLMGAGALGLMAAFDIDPLLAVFGGPDSDPVGGATAGAAVGFVIVALSHFGRNAGPMRTMRDEFSKTLGTQSDGAVLAIALSSAIGEELLFRGALQPLLGLWPTVILFGLLHGGGIRRLWAWTVFAILGGAIFAGLTEWSGSLLPAIVMHFTINYFNLLTLTRETPADPGSES